MIEKTRKEIDQANEQLNNIIHDMEKKIGTVIKRHEGDYLKGYSIYVRDKERELRTLITKLNERHNNNAIKDEIIYELKQ